MGQTEVTRLTSVREL